MVSKWPVWSSTTRCPRPSEQYDSRDVQRHEAVVGPVDDGHGHPGPGEGSRIEVGAVDGRAAEEVPHGSVVEPEPVPQGEIGHRGQGEHP